MCKTRLFLSAIFMIAIFGVDVAKGKFNDRSTYQINVLDKLQYPLEQFWKNQEEGIDETLTKVFKCPVDFDGLRRIKRKEPLKKCPKAEWLQDLWKIVRNNYYIVRFLGIMRMSLYTDEHINYMAKNSKLITPEMIEVFRKVVAYGKQFHLPLEKSVFNVYGSDTEYPENTNTSYNGLLRSYNLKALNNNQMQELSKLIKSVSQKVVPPSEKLIDIANDCGNTVMNGIYYATHDVFFSMNGIDHGINIEYNVEWIKESNEICKKQMADPSLPQKINAALEKIKPFMAEIVAAQQNLPHDIEEVLKKASKKSSFKLVCQ